MRRIFKLTGIVILGISANITFAQAFSFTFDWGKIPICTTGNPNTVNNPTFNLAEVPTGGAKITFHLRDNNVPEFNHGGGTVAYLNKSIIASGAFKYQSPCPPDGSHTYVWTATVYDKSGKKLMSASSSKSYP